MSPLATWQATGALPATHPARSLAEWERLAMFWDEQEVRAGLAGNPEAAEQAAQESWIAHRGAADARRRLEGLQP